MNLTAQQAKAVAVAFMRLTPTRREDLARGLLVYRDGLPERTNEAALEILRRVKEMGMERSLAVRVGVDLDAWELNRESQSDRPSDG